MIMTRDYHKQYMNLKSRIQLLKAKLLYVSHNEATLIFTGQLDKLAKELDMRYFDERHLDALENDVNNIENDLL